MTFLQVRLGSANLLDKGSNVQEITVERTIPYPSFTFNIYYHDIALVVLTKAAIISKNVKPICLHTKFLANTDINPNISFVTIGFGITNFDSLPSNTLMKSANLRYTLFLNWRKAS